MISKSKKIKKGILNTQVKDKGLDKIFAKLRGCPYI